jgi:hypothetical protein
MRILNRSLDRRGSRVAVGQNQNRILLWLVNTGQPSSLSSAADAILIHRVGALPLLAIERSMTKCRYGSFSRILLDACQYRFQGLCMVIQSLFLGYEPMSRCQSTANTMKEVTGYELRSGLACHRARDQETNISNDLENVRGYGEV